MEGHIEYRAIYGGHRARSLKLLSKGSRGEILTMQFNPDYWPSHRQGEQTRSQILSLLDNPLSLEEIAEQVNRSVRQVRRQITQLVSEGRVKRLANGQIVKFCMENTVQKKGHI